MTVNPRQLTATLVIVVCGIGFVGLQWFESYDEYFVADALEQIADRVPDEELAREFRVYLSSIENRKQTAGVLLGVTNIIAALCLLTSLRRQGENGQT